MILRCRGCRTILISSPSQIVAHDRLEPERRPHFGGNQPKIPSESCTTIFIEQPDWLPSERLYESGEGKIDCPKCAAKLGAFSFVGFPCSCGRWIAPAFGLTVSKIDKIIKSQ